MDVLVSGMLVVDILAEVPTHFKKGEKHEIPKIIIQGGAPAGNAACFIAQWGIKTGFVGYKANNTLSKIANQELERYNVNTKLMLNKTHFQPAIAVVEVDENNGERTVFYSLQGYSPLSVKDINEDWIKEKKLLLVDGYDIQGNIELLKLANKYNIPSVLDIETGNINDLKQMIKLGSHIILPLEGAKHITQLNKPQDCLMALSSLTDGQIVVTDGAHGCWAWQHGNVIHQPAFPTTVVDTTGCGDAFHAAYAIALLEKKTLIDRLQFASAYAAIIAQHFGGRSYFPSAEEVENVIQKNTTLC
ncbi:hypothetical protein KFZ70_06075 [Tamlana fucoidanivorans]|uniref:Ribokinase n=1 Tax=Allotamlana fucoidanivorans TaxID=2583814 RepID=A0A5C4SP45_9FLAO|nr:PfkB family carbohydrate kinase [Tamlana fucoidanivorans]TNJ45420.1 ribokinase [Tamlana fucoidanivorans]